MRSASRRFVFFVFLVSVTCLGWSAHARAQDTAGISGVVTDPSGAAVSAAKITVKNTETGSVRVAATDAAGRYEVVALPVGNYEVTATKDKFQEVIRGGVDLAVGQDARVDISLPLGDVSQRVTVTEEAATVGTTSTDNFGLVTQTQVKDLPLNGRSFDLLMTLSPGVVNFTWEKTGGIGISNSTTANMFSVSGNRPQQNLFLLNGVEYTGAAENNMTPGGASGQLLGVDAVREFNLLTDSYSAEYGKHPGAQVSIVTQSGSNQWHGSAFEFLRNNALDAANFFDLDGAPGFQRNQFGGTLGGPIQKDKTFVFANYEGFRENLHQTSVALVPDAQSRADASPVIQQMGLLNLWPTAPANAPDFKVAGNDGVAQFFSSPLQTIREDFGTSRLDHIFSSKDSAAAIYTLDDSRNVTGTPADPYSSDVTTLREQVLSLEETRAFSPTITNTARIGYSRAGYFFTGEPTPGTPAASVPGFLAGLPVGAVVVGGSQASNPQAQIGLAGSNNGSNLYIARNLMTYTDQVSISRGRNQWSAGVWFQRFQSNEEIALSQYGQMTFTGLPALLGAGGTAPTASFLFDPAPTPLGWRALFGAWYVEDVIRPSSRLTVTIGFRDEFSTGWNETSGRAANYTFPNGVISSQPNIGNAFFTENRAKFLPQPRLGAAWSPFGHTTVIRAGFGMYNDLQDALGYRADQNAPFNPVYTIGAGPIANLKLPIAVNAAPPASALLVPGGVQPDMSTPTLVSWSLKLEQQLGRNTSLSIGYVGSHGYHELLGADMNAPAPIVCPASPCPAKFPTTINPATGQPVWAALAGQPVPAGTYFTPTTAKPNPTIAQTWTWLSQGSSSYNALQLNATHRFSGGFSIRGAYTWSKTLDDGDSLNATAAANAPGLVSNPYDIRADWGPATYDVRNVAVIAADYDLPFGRGHVFFSTPGRLAGFLAGGWTINSIVTVQSGFPFTPQLSYNPANNGDSRNPVRPFVNPAFSGPVVLGSPSQWYNPNAFIAPPSSTTGSTGAAGGFFGDLGRDTYVGPGLATWDFSVMKDTRVRERMDVQFRAEIFNLLNRANFNTPNLIADVLQPSPNQTLPVVSPTAGQITSTSTTSRQIQFGLKLLW